MSSIYNSIQRLWAMLRPPSTPKQSNPIRIGLIGASKIAPMAIIDPAKSHPEVIITSVAARDPQRAQVFAKKNSIPKVHPSYQSLVDDPAIDAVYISLPNSLHYEWALKAIESGKHVLLEKPSCSNTTETSELFNHPSLTNSPSPPGSTGQIIILEAFHNQFHPSFQLFLSLCHSIESTSPISKVTATTHLFKGYLPSDDIRLNSTLSGGCLMDLGTYPLSLIRLIPSRTHSTSSTPKEKPILVSASVEKALDPKIDLSINASWNFSSPSNDQSDLAKGEISSSLRATGGYSFLPTWLNSLVPRLEVPKCVVEFKESPVQESSMKLKEGEQHFLRKTLTFHNFLVPHIWHRIDVSETHIIRLKTTTYDESERVLRTWTKTESRKAYNWSEDLGNGDYGVNVRKGEVWWSTYRYQLEEFVNRIRGRKGSGVWVSGEDSVEQMELIDGVYAMAGLGIRGV